LRHAFLSTSFDDQLDEVQDFRVLHPACDLAQEYVVSNIIEEPLDRLPTTTSLGIRSK
jgi:hypothetical protein